MAKRYDVLIDGHKMVAYGYNEHLSSTPVILLHGIGLSASFWPDDGAGLVSDQRWYAVCLPGHYPAAFAEGFRRADLTAELVAKLISGTVRALVGDQPVILMGHSTGGFSALATAAQYPELVKAVISISGFVQGRWGGPLALMQAEMRMGRIGEAFFRLSWGMAALSPRTYFYAGSLYTHNWRAYLAYPDALVNIRRVYADVKQHQVGALAHYFARMPQTDIQAWLPRITAPTLVITGAQDRIVPVEQAQRIANGIPHAKLVGIPNCGHMVMMEQAEPYSVAVKEWLAAYCAT